MTEPLWSPRTTRDHTARFHDHSWEDRLFNSPDDYLDMLGARVERLAQPRHDDLYRSCWPWQGYVMSNGYGTLSVNGKHRLAHRVIWLLWVEPIADGMVLDHLCERRNCVNVMHLDPCSPEENTRRARMSERMRQRNLRYGECRNGHTYTAETTGRDDRGFRCCLICRPDDAIPTAAQLPLFGGAS